MNKTEASCGLLTHDLYCTETDSFYIMLIVINYTVKIGDLHAAVRLRLHTTHKYQHDVDKTLRFETVKVLDQNRKGYWIVVLASSFWT